MPIQPETPKNLTRAKAGKLPLALAAACLAALPLSFSTRCLAAPAAGPIQAPAAAASGRVSGTVTAVSGNVLTVKDDKGVESKVTVPDSARVLQLPAGAKSLSAANSIKVGEIAVGDRVLAKATADGGNYTASTLVAMKQADIAQMQQRELQEWRTKGVSGLVKSVDAAAQTVTVATGNGATAKTLVIQASKATNIRRYAPNSTKFDEAKPATLDQIKPGDQLRAKGEKNADGTGIAADAIVAGTFRNIAGTVLAVDPAANTVTVSDFATKKPFTVSINADSQLHKLSPMMAQAMAMRLKGGAAPPSGAPPSPGAAPSGAPPSGAPSRSAAEQPPSEAGAAPGQHGGDLQQALNRAPILQLADLKKGDAVMVLTTEGQAPDSATAVTLLAGVEPLLQASPRASQSVLSASWNLGGGEGGGQDAQ
jgi:hypothetical protein